MSALSSRQRLLKTLNHEEPDRVPYDLAATQVTGISIGAYAHLREYLGLEPKGPQVCDAVQQICVPHDDVMERLRVDTRGLFPLTSHNWNVVNEDGGDCWLYRDEWGLVHQMPKQDGHWYSLCESPLAAETTLTTQAVDAHPWPDATDRTRIEGLRAQAETFRAAAKAVVIKGLCAGIFEMACRIRGMDRFMMDMITDEAAAVHLMRKIMELKAAFWETALAELGDVVDVVAEADDYGTQESMLISPEMFRRLIKPLTAELIGTIRRKLTHGYVFFHSCGNVRQIIPDLIEIGADILNPVHIAAAGMDPAGLKRDFGKDVVFWGGGVETQHVLPHGTPDDVRDNVRRNLDALAPDGGYVFNTVHNIQPEVPPENVMAMWEALHEFGAY